MIELFIFSIIFIFLLSNILINLFKINSIQPKIILIGIISILVFYYLSKNENRLPFIQKKFVRNTIGICILFVIYKLAVHLYSYGFNHISSIIYILIIFLIIIIFLNVYYFNKEFDKLYKNLYKRLNNKN